MGKRTVFLIAILLAFIALGAMAQQKIPFVDVEAAQKQADQLQEENSTLTADADKLKKENLDFESQIGEWQKQVNEIDFILTRVKEKGADLYAIYADIVDKPTKVKAKEAIDKNRELRTQLEAKKNTVNGQMLSARKKIDTNNKNINVANTKISKNTDTINMLNASVEKTNNQTQQLNTYVDTVNDINSQAEAVLKQ